MRTVDLLDRMQPVYLTGRNRTIDYMNGPFRDIAPDLFPEFKSADRLDQPRPPAPRELDAILDRIAGGEDTVEILQQVQTADGTRYYRSSHFRLVEDGAPAGYAGVYTDVTSENDAARYAERTTSRFEDIVRAASDWVWETDKNLNLTYVSNRIGDLTETPPRQLIGRYLFSLGVPEEAERRQPEIGRLPDTLMPFCGLVLLIGRTEETRRRVALSGAPYFDDNSGDFAGYRGTGTDITREFEAEHRARVSQAALLDSMKELQERNIQLAQALEKSNAASQAKTDFLGKMSHELRTPLNAIIGFSDLSLLESFGKLPDRYKEYFGDIRKAADHLLTIINDILDAVNLDAGKAKIQLEKIKLKPLVEEVLPLVEAEARSRGVDIAAVTVDDGWAVKADRGRLRQILINLVVNALKFTEQGGSVGIETGTGDDGTVLLTVWDTGIGISREQQGLIFDGFHQVQADPVIAPTEGTGLGLTISQQLARLMGGDLRVESELEKGSRFTIILPAAAKKQKKKRRARKPVRKSA